MQKIFFLGGLGTLHGYGQKEYCGIEFWLADLEYRIGVPGSNWNVWLFYELGQMVGSGDWPATAVKNSLGLGITFNDLIRMNISKRLDRIKDSVTLYFRLKHQF
jgi:hemolysin activation/secretion protein